MAGEPATQDDDGEISMPRELESAALADWRAGQTWAGRHYPLCFRAAVQAFVAGVLAERERCARLVEEGYVSRCDLYSADDIVDRIILAICRGPTP